MAWPRSQIWLNKSKYMKQKHILYRVFKRKTWCFELQSGTSAASMTSTASMTSVASTASYHQKTYWAWCCYYPGNKMTYLGLPMWNGSSKILYFMDFGHSFCWRLWRPWMLLSTKSKGHKSNFRISWMYRSCFYDLKVHFWWPNKCSKHQVLRSNTL